MGLSRFDMGVRDGDHLVIGNKFGQVMIMRESSYAPDFYVVGGDCDEARFPSFKKALDYASDQLASLVLGRGD